MKHPILVYYITRHLFAWGLGVNLYLTGFLLTRDFPPFIGQLNYVAHLITFPSLVIFLLTAWLYPYKRMLLWLAPGVVAFLFWHAPYLIPKSTPQVDGPTFTVAQFNVWIHADNDRIVEVIREMDADIVGLQENRPALEAKIQENLSEMYPYQVLENVEQAYEGLGLLSRYPILESHIEITPGDIPHVHLDRMRYLRAVLDVNGQPLVVYVIHPPIVSFRLGLQYDDQYHNDEIRLVTELVAQETLPLLVLCDCNLPPISRTYDWMEAVLDDAYRVQGWGVGTTYWGRIFINLPIFRLDYIWYRGGTVPLEIEVWNDDGTSDHAPLWARFALPDPIN